MVANDRPDMDEGISRVPVWYFWKSLRSFYYLLNFANVPWALLVSRVELRLCVCADYCTVPPHNADKLLWACHCTTYGQFQCLVLRIVLLFDSYFSLSGLFLPYFSVPTCRTTEHVVPAHNWVMTTFVPFHVWCFMTPRCLGYFPQTFGYKIQQLCVPIGTFFFVKFDAFSVLNVKLILFCGTWRCVVWYVKAAAFC
jgi:hypothetical protein